MNKIIKIQLLMNTTRKIILITKVLLEIKIPEPIIHIIVKKVFEEDLICPGCDKFLDFFYDDDDLFYDGKCKVCDICLYCALIKWSRWTENICKDCYKTQKWGTCGRCGVNFNDKLDVKCRCSWVLRKRYNNLIKRTIEF